MKTGNLYQNELNTHTNCPGDVAARRASLAYRECVAPFASYHGREYRAVVLFLKALCWQNNRKTL